MFKILEQNGIDNENIDGGAFNNFAAGNRDGILKGVLNECSLVAEGNSISIGTGVIILQGIRVKITDPEIISVSSVPSEPVRYQIVAQLVMEEGDLSCSFFVRIPTELIKDNFYNSGKGNGIYQQELGRVTHGTNGDLTDIQRTLDIISGGGGISTHSVEIGNVSTNMIDAGLPAEVDVDSRVEGEKVVIDFNFSFPESRANTIYTVKNLTVKETNNRQFLSDVFLPEGEIENSDTVCLQGLDISSLSPELQNYVNSIEDSGIIYLNRVSPKAFFAVLGAVARPDLYEVNNSGAFSLYLVGNEYGQYQLFGTVISDQSGSAVSAVFDNAGNPLVYKYVKPDTGIPKSDLESSVQTSLSKADSALQSIPIATPSVVGGVKPVTKTSEMTQEVGVDSNGALWTKGGGTTIEYMTDAEVDALFAPQDELIGTWVFGESLSIEEDASYAVSFITNGLHFKKIKLDYVTFAGRYMYYVDAMDGETTAFDTRSWEDDNYKTIQITDVSSLTNREAFETWLKANATKQSENDPSQSTGGSAGNL